MKLKVVLPAVTDPQTPTPSLGLGTLMASLNANDEIVVTAEQAQQPAMWEDADVVVITVGSTLARAFNLAELYRRAGAHVVLIGSELEFLAESGKQRQTVFLGPADEMWPAFLRDLRCGEAGHCYASDFGLRDAGLFVSPVHVA